jgi:hypothetical protein
MADQPTTRIVVHRSADLHKGDRILIDHDIKHQKWNFGFRFWRWRWQFAITREHIRTITNVTDTTLTIK